MFTGTMSLAHVNKETLTACSGNLCSSSFTGGEVFCTSQKDELISWLNSLIR